MLLIMTSTIDELRMVSTLITFNDFEPGDFSVFFAIFGSGGHFKSDVPKWLEINLDNLQRPMKFLA